VANRKHRVARKEMNDRERAAFEAYHALGDKRSLVILRQRWLEVVAGRRQAPIRTLQYWSKKFEWQRRIADIDAEANRRAVQTAIKAAVSARVDVMRLFSAVARHQIAEVEAMLATDPGADLGVSVSDLYRLWQMARVEMGLPTDRLTHDGTLRPPEAGRMTPDEFDALTQEARAVLGMVAGRRSEPDGGNSGE
jgi:hypothetical protein